MKHNHVTLHAKQYIRVAKARMAKNLPVDKVYLKKIETIVLMRENPEIFEMQNPFLSGLSHELKIEL